MKLYYCVIFLFVCLFQIRAQQVISGNAYINFREEVIKGYSLNDLEGIRNKVLAESVRIRQMNEEFSKSMLKAEISKDYHMWGVWSNLAKEKLDESSNVIFYAEMLLFKVINLDSLQMDFDYYNEVLCKLLMSIKNNTTYDNDFKVRLIYDILKTNDWRGAEEVSQFLLSEKTLSILYMVISQSSDEGKKKMLNSLVKYEQFQNESELDNTNKINAHKFKFKRMMKAMKYITDRSNQENDTDTLSGLMEATRENMEQYLDLEAAIGENESDELLSKFQKYRGNDSSVGELMRKKNQHRPDRRKAVVQKKESEE